MNRHRGGLFSRARGGDTADLREHNLSLVLRYLRDNGPSSRAQIAESSTLGLSTLTGMIGELKALDLVHEGLAPTQSRLGRPTHSVSLSGDAWVVAGLRVDVDGVQAKTATVGGDHLGSYADRADLRGGDAAPAIRMLRAAIDWIIESIDPQRTLTAITVAVPGIISPCGDSVARSESLGWSDIDLLAAVREQLLAGGCGGAVVELARDSAVAALGLARGELHERIGRRTTLYFGGERTVIGAVLLGGESLVSGSPGEADFAGIRVLAEGRGVERLDRVVALSTLLTDASVHDRDAAVALVDRFPRDALASFVSALADGHDGAASVLASAMRSLAQAIESAVAVLGAEVVMLDGYLGVLASLVDPPVDAAVDVIALGSHPSRIVDGAVFAARDARLAQPLHIRN
ncbi:ROK family protein [Agreia pratensis]|uniref:Sugar kinase of the NBD/HSP70 family, may contain an N-terminal HTH domain n=1 Tax=Agreia pratensis TaxID=150121 RepID=A0A1X7JHK6_9MICO|nr:ROK family protein [Agreia pratensis]SMG27220.1 Sugar kinase of the NBD/HSP70 family, may contain an N-terminal HTH domain [Agreia pratensis]